MTALVWTLAYILGAALTTAAACAIEILGQHRSGPPHSYTLYTSDGPGGEWVTTLLWPLAVPALLAVALLGFGASAIRRALLRALGGDS